MKSVYTLDDLGSRDALDAGAEKPARLAVLGWPIAHSLSPQMHQAALDSGGINARYIRLEVEPGRVPEAFARMRALGFIGCNVTVPHKFDALASCDDVDPEALILGVVNTVRFDQDAIRGFNTDGPGFALAIEDEFNRNLGALDVAIAGAGGGAGQAVAAQCVLAGVAKLVLVNRTAAKLDSLVDRLDALGRPTEIIPLSFNDHSLANQLHACDLIVNTSSVGLDPHDPSIIPVTCLLPTHLVYDTIYKPKGAMPTQTLKLAADHGSQTGDGRSMLLHQGALAFQHWFPETNPLPVMREALA